jgi:hypothetical protein
MRPETIGICGGGSEVEAAVVSDERRWKEVGVEARRSVYEMKEMRLEGFVRGVDVGEGGEGGEGGWVFVRGWGWDQGRGNEVGPWCWWLGVCSSVVVLEPPLLSAAE